MIAVIDFRIGRRERPIEEEDQVSKRLLYIHLYNVHGLFRAHNLELGRDADTGGQTKYVLELAKSLSNHPYVGQVDIFTRRIEDSRVDADYAKPTEHIDRKIRIVRIRCGGPRYRRKETLWDHLDEFVDNCIRFIRSQGRIPHVLHAHYADAGYVAMHLARLFGTPFIFTGHSLGRSKLERLLASGMSEEDANRQYRIRQRIDAEELVLRYANLVIASTRQERIEQYGLYVNEPARFAVVPPGIDVQVFRPYTRAPRDRLSREIRGALTNELNRFLSVRSKPLILALSRPDRRKNIPALVRAYGPDPDLRRAANLAIFAGIRKDIRDMPDNEREVLTDMLFLMDSYDLYGRMAIPKRHEYETEVPELYRIAARSHGVFVNPALTEPFGLTLIEAAASGLPVVATNDGGPRDILENCQHGLLVDPTDEAAIAEAIKLILTDRKRWIHYSENGIEGVRRHYTWEAHTRHYVEEIRRLTVKAPTLPFLSPRETPLGRRLEEAERFVVTDIDDTLLGDDGSLAQLVEILERKQGELVFGVATGRAIDSARKVLRENGVPEPEFVISSVGAEIYIGDSDQPDPGWTAHIDHRWSREQIMEALKGTRGIELQEEETQRPFKLSYFVEMAKFDMGEVRRRLANRKIRYNLVHSNEQFLDFLPHRASKGKALRYLAFKLDVPLQSILASGDSGNDRDMLTGRILAVVVGNHSADLEPLQGRGYRDVYFSEKGHAAGIIDGLLHFGFISDEDISKTQRVLASFSG